MTPDQQRAYAALELGPYWLSRTQHSLHPVESPVELAPNAAVPGELTWDELAIQVSQCRLCGLSSSRRQTVFGVGPQNARLMIVGEAPGQEEDASGEPFVGPAGNLLDNMLRAIGMNRGEHVFIANVLKCRPPGNRNPEAGEVAACSPYLQRQVALLQPQLILVMGKFAAQAMLGNDASIASLRGRQHAYDSGGRPVPVVVTYHPAYLLRNLPDKSKAWTDLLFVRRLLAELHRT